MPTTLPESQSMSASNKSQLASVNASYVDAAEFRRLIVSCRRMERADKLAPRMRGLRDLDTGELFLTEERWLMERAR